MPVDNPPFTVLLVEDEMADALLFQEMLADVSPTIAVLHVMHGQEALDYMLGIKNHIGRKLPDLIILDLNMPIMDGHEFLRQVKKQEQVRSTPVLVLSTSDHPSDIQRSYSNFASGYIVKPGNHAEYVKILEIIEKYWRGIIRLPTLGDIAYSIR